MSLRTVSRDNFAEARLDIERSVLESQTEIGGRLGIAGEVMFSKPYCHIVSPEAVNRIKTLGWAAVTDIRHIDGVIYHEYLRFPGSGIGQNEIIADGAWAQFMPSLLLSGHEPKVLVGTRSHVMQTARNYGVPSLHAVFRCWMFPAEQTAAKRRDDYFDPRDIKQLQAILDMQSPGHP